MCLIIDTDTIHRVFPTPCNDYAPIFRALNEKRARLVYGGQLKRDYEKTHFRRLLLRLDQQGSARQVPDAEVDAQAKQLVESKVCRSNDQHILALAIVGRVRLLCTMDNDLAADFRNPLILNAPRGNIYRRGADAGRLLRRHCHGGRD